MTTEWPQFVVVVAAADTILIALIVFSTFCKAHILKALDTFPKVVENLAAVVSIVTIAALFNRLTHI